MNRIFNQHRIHPIVEETNRLAAEALQGRAFLLLAEQQFGDSPDAEDSLTPKLT